MDGVKFFGALAGAVVVAFMLRRTGPVALLYMVALFCWYPLALSTYGPLDKILELTSFVEFAAVGALILSLRTHSPRPPNWWLLGIYGISGLGLWYLQPNPDPVVAWRAVRWNILIPVVSYVAAWRLIQTRREAELAVLAFVAGQMFLAAISLGAVAGLFGLPESNDQSVIGDQTFRLANYYYVPFVGSLQLGGNWTVFFHCYAVPFLVARILLVRRKTESALLFLALTANAAAVLLAASRTAVMALFLATAVVVLISARRPLTPYGRRIKSASLVTIAVLFVVVVTATRFYSGGAISERIAAAVDLITRPDMGRLGEDDIVTRGTMYGEFLPTVLAAPLGVGFVESFAYLGGPDIGPHAQYLFLLLGTGIIGLVSWVAFHVHGAVRFGSTAVRHEDPIRWLVIGCQGAVVSYLINCFMIHTYLVRGADMMLFIIIGIGMRSAVLSRAGAPVTDATRRLRTLATSTFPRRAVGGYAAGRQPNSRRRSLVAYGPVRRTGRERW